MNTKNTWWLLGLAALLLAFIVAYNKYVIAPLSQPRLLLPGFETNAVTAIQVRNAGQPEIMVVRTNDTWHLLKPLSYPAQAGSIDQLLASLAHLKPDLFLTAMELQGRTAAEAEFGFDNPMATLVLHSGRHRRQIIIGSRTAPGDQIFVEVVGMPGVSLLSTNLLNAIPQQAADWRDSALLDWKTLIFDRVLVNNGTRTLELQRNPTNGIWRLVRLQAAADGQLMEGLLQDLRSLNVADFVTDDPRADLDAFGLQTPDLDITFVNGTNTTAVLQFGKSPTNDPALVYARPGGLSSVVTVPKNLLTPWRAPASDFRDRHLVRMTTLPPAIEVIGKNRFTVVHQTNGLWQVQPEGFPADTNTMNLFISTLAKMEVVKFVRDAVIETDLPVYGLGQPQRQYTLRAGVETNSPSVCLQFGTNEAGLVFARRTDEASVYEIQPVDFYRLPSASWELHDRRIWHFTEDDVTRVLIEESGRTQELVRSGTNTWSLVRGATSVVNPFAVEETVHRIGNLEAAWWTARGTFDRAQYGFTDPPHRLTFTLKDGSQRGLEFGGVAPSQFPYALVTLHGEPWLCEFPWATYQFIESYLSLTSP